jgi:GNAT superfamily N-acetyltransferase
MIEPHIHFERFTRSREIEVLALIQAAIRDPHLGEFVKQKKKEDFMLFLVGTAIVGFAIPRRDGDGYYRTGAIYVAPFWRKKGIAKKFVSQYFEKVKGRAFIEDTNVASLALFQGLGFKRTGKSVSDGDTRLFEYLKAA